MNSPERIIRVMFIDDNVLAAKAMERWFASEPDLHFTGWTGDAEESVRLIANALPDVVLLDLEMPCVDTLSLIPRLLAAHPAARIVMLSGHLRSSDIGKALDAGAAGYIGKDEPTDVITALLRRAAGGECVLSPLVQQAFLDVR